MKGEGIIYVVGEQGTNNVKIGVTNETEHPVLMNKLQRGNPRKLELLYRYVGSIKLIREFQESLKEYRLMGEWYDIRDRLDSLEIQLPNL